MKLSGFTFIEVLVAMLIFALSAVAAIDLVHGAVRATQDSKEVTTATWLLQSLMAELETKIETQGFDQGCEKKTEAKFSAPYEDFTWTAYCNEINFHISESASKMMQQVQGDANEPVTEDLVMKMLLNTASSYMSSAMRELHAEVHWLQRTHERTISATTHLVRLDTPLATGAASKSDDDGDGGGSNP